VKANPAGKSTANRLTLISPSLPAQKDGIPFSVEITEPDQTPGEQHEETQPSSESPENPIPQGIDLDSSTDELLYSPKTVVPAVTEDEDVIPLKTILSRHQQDNTRSKSRTFQPRMRLSQPRDVHPTQLFGSKSANIDVTRARLASPPSIDRIGWNKAKLHDVLLDAIDDCEVVLSLITSTLGK
jgi:hypothetical protein